MKNELATHTQLQLFAGWQCSSMLRLQLRAYIYIEVLLLGLKPTDGRINGRSVGRSFAEKITFNEKIRDKLVGYVRLQVQISIILYS